MQTVIQRKGNLDYIPPMRNGQNLLGITWEEWRSLFQRIEELGKYEYVILDLSESIQGRHRSIHYVRLSIDRCTATYAEHRRVQHYV